MIAGHGAGVEGGGVEERVTGIVREEVGELADGRTIRFFSWEVPDVPEEPDPTEPA